MPRILEELPAEMSEDRPVRWLAVLAALTTLAGAQAPKTKDVLARVDAYLSEYGSRLAEVVAEETYRQDSLTEPGLPLTRSLRSDYALMFVRGPGWMAFRDTFEVDGQPVRDREERLRRLLASGAVAQAEGIDKLNSRYNLATDRLPRSVNVPTLALNILQPHYRNRFSVRRLGSDPRNGGPDWRIEYRERDRPTIVRTPDGHNQASRIEVLADPATGEVHQTTISWEHVKGSIVVDYERVPGISVPVPISMIEQYITGAGDEISGHATYSNYRTFQTSGRLIDP
jgi:hypothetical protein